MLNIEITPQREALLKGFDNEFHALLRVNADEVPNPRERKNTLNLAIVIDRSGSMSGQPLDEAKRSAIMMVEQMHSDDRVAIVTYDKHCRISSAVHCLLLRNNLSFSSSEIFKVVAQQRCMRVG